ncbi:MAG: hypothetical protein JXB39_15505 [Deltaproteobacteria bacterium]|nr:hypothetical protein [Deltaproteobacteria bacterium]
MDEAHRKQAAIEYRRLHEARRRLNDRLMNRLDRRQVEVAARTLGFWHEGILVFDSEEDSAVLVDFAIHATGEGGRNAPRGLLDDGALGLDDDERRLLAGMVHARFGLYRVDEVLPGFGVRVRNLFSKQSYDLADMGLSETARPDVAFLGRLFDAGVVGECV